MARECMCGCGELTQGRFYDGHDGRVRGWYTKAMKLPTHQSICDQGLHILSNPEALDYFDDFGFDMSTRVRRYLEGLRHLLEEYCDAHS